MNRFFDLIDKYKYGLIAVVAGYVFIFSYLQMESYTKYIPISPFQTGPEILDEEIILDQEQIEVPENFSGDVKNMARDRNDDREKSMDDWSQNKPSKSVEQQVKDYEKKLFEETGGQAQRERMIQEYEEKLRKDAEKKKQQNQAKTDPSSSGGDKSYAGNVMVDWELSNRNPFQNKNWYIRNPGYKCGHGSSGKVVIDVTVNQNGSVVSAKFNASSSSGASPCMIEQATEYAKMSRFDYSSSAPNNQQGRIYYTFISQ